MRRDQRLKIITEAIERLVPGAIPAYLSVRVTDTLPGAMGHDGEPHTHTWTGSPAGLAERLFIAVYGSLGAQDPRSPLAQAGDAKRARDLGGELGALTAADHELTSPAWYPVRPGDLVHVHYGHASAGQTPAFGETYIISHAGEPGHAVGGLLDMQLLAHTLPATVDDAEGLTGCFAVEAADDPLYELWFEVGAHLLTIVRDGCVVHNGGAK